MATSTRVNYVMQQVQSGKMTPQQAVQTLRIIMQSPANAQEAQEASTMLRQYGGVPMAPSTPPGQQQVAPPRPPSSSLSPMPPSRPAPPPVPGVNPRSGVTPSGGVGGVYGPPIPGGGTGDTFQTADTLGGTGADPSLGVNLPEFDPAKYPGAYFKDLKDFSAVTPQFDPRENDEAWQYYMMKSGLRDTYAQESGEDDYKSASALAQLLGGKSIEEYGLMPQADQMYATQGIMDQLLGGGGGYLNPQAVINAMFSKLGEVSDPNIQRNMIAQAIEALKPFMTDDAWQMLASRVGRTGQEAMVKQYESPTEAGPGDFLDMLKYLES